MDHRARLTEMRAAQRLSECDPTLFAEPAVAADRLGWVGLPARAAAEADTLTAFAHQVVERGVTDVVLLGMGGSSLAPLVLARILGSAPGYPTLHVVDTTSPDVISALTRELRPANTLVVVSSKSGTTTEPLSLEAIFREWMLPVLGLGTGAHFVAVTDPGSPLEAMADRMAFDRVMDTPLAVGGRYAALTPFAMVPAALMGIDVARLAATARAMETSCIEDSARNPGLALAAWLADAYATGRDKLTIVSSPAYAAFGLWVEQLVAESTGKDGAGLLPVLEPGSGQPAAHGEDRMTFIFRRPDDNVLAALPSRLPEDEPVFEVVLDDARDIAGEFVRWEWAVALFSALVGIEPFDQPNVAEAKAATEHILARGTGEGALDVGDEGLAPALRDLATGIEPGSYVAVLAYLPDDPRLLGPLVSACSELAAGRRIPVTLEIGPRYLHSTGQYHKGGPTGGHFIVVSAAPGRDVEIPGKPYTLGGLNGAQAEGDVATLRAHGRPVVFVKLPRADERSVRAVADAVTAAMRP